MGGPGSAYVRQIASKIVGTPLYSCFTSASARCDVTAGKCSSHVTGFYDRLSACHHELYIGFGDVMISTISMALHYDAMLCVQNAFLLREVYM